ncbi:Mu transposase C-terminal domain-containing protein, partial [uncultured Desulfovibrio sp.]|uniref:Mu transposase C-terminal domain-containing protein n=1 Tax=uncultured Desulfovibrio sp. TaxID=167968 RepID=UPI00266EF606
SYTGWDIAHKPARLHRNEKLHRRLHEKLGRRPLTLEETYEWLAYWFELYASRPQATTHLRGRTPGEVFEEGRGPGVDMERLTLLMLQKEVRTISKDGIRLDGRLFWHEALFNRRHPVLVRYDWQLSPYTVLVYDLEGHRLCEARDRYHYGIAAGIHPAARALGTAEQQQDLSDALELKKRQECAAKAGIRQMTETVILPEARQRQITSFHKAIPATEPIRKSPALSATEKAAIEAAKAAGAQARAKLDAPTYEPSIFKRFPDEPARYDYLFTALHERGAELVPEDAAFMEYFENTPQFQRNFKPLYDGKLELLHRQSNIATA